MTAKEMQLVIFEVLFKKYVEEADEPELFVGLQGNDKISVLHTDGTQMLITVHEAA